MNAQSELKLKVSANRRFLVYAGPDESGAERPFFYLGDTAWELFHRLDREQAEHYLTTRARQGFTVVQAVVLAEHQFERPNAYGHLPLIDNDVTRPMEEYFQHVDFIVDRTAELGMWTGMLPTWGDKWNRKWGSGPEIFTPENAFFWGQYLGRRYRDRPIIWILGGDRPIDSPAHAEIIRNMAAGLKEGDGGNHLRTFHPQGQQTSSQYFHAEEWLDFNMYQTGHMRDRDCYRAIAEDYALIPIKPCMDAEPGYEDHPNGFKPENGYLDATDVRKSAYWDLFAGAFGHTYGCHDIWQFLGVADFKPVSWARTDWRTALTLPGAEQMRHVRKLLESRPFLTRIPDQSLIVSTHTPLEHELSEPERAALDERAHHLQATRDSEGRYAFVYFSAPVPAVIDLRKLAGPQVCASWYDPRTGAFGTENTYTLDAHLFVPPGDEQTPLNERDWVLVLDSYPA